MKKLPEAIRRFLSGNVKTETGVTFCLILNILTLLVPAIVLERIYFGDTENNLFGLIFLAAFFFCSLTKKYAFYGFLRIAVWVWAAVAVATKTNWALWAVIPFYIFMVIGVLRVSIVWWSDDDKVTEKDK